jgi:molybdopterin converting factor small subunit
MPAVRLRLFAAARETAGCTAADFDADDLDTLLADACARFGSDFAAVLATSRVWVNGDEPPGEPPHALARGDEVAVLPPVSGGAR